MLKINQGEFIGTKYIKRMSFNKAVLWNKGEISLNPNITSRFKLHKTDTIIFEDYEKNERWTVGIDELRRTGVFKAEGQEKQWYFPIGIFKVTKIRE